LPATRTARASERPSAATIAALWVASRWASTDVPSRIELYRALAPDDPRRTVIASELARLEEDLVERAAIVRAARDLLTARVGPVQILEVEHRP